MVSDDLIELTARCQYDPDAWALAAFDWGHGELAKHTGPRTWQREVNQDIRDHLADPATRFQPLRLAIASGHGIGKSAEMGMLANWAMSCWTDAKVLITSNTGQQLETKTSPEIGMWFRRSITADWFDVGVQAIKYADPAHALTWRCDFATWSERNTEAFAGLHNEGKIILVLFDEASGIHAKVWEVALGALTDENTVIIWIAFGNPTLNTGEFRECFRKNAKLWKTKHISSMDVEGTNKPYLQSILDHYGETSDQAKVRVLGQFPARSVDQFISDDAVRAAIKRKPYTDLSDVLILGVDVARHGDDSSVIYTRRGMDASEKPIILDGVNTMQLAARVKVESDRLDADAVFIDETGIGAGVVDRCHQMGMRNVVGVNFGWASDAWVEGHERSFNKRTEMWVKMRAAIDSGISLPDMDRLIEELGAPNYSYNEKNQIILEKKKEIKKRIGISPDIADALALTFAYPVTARTVMEAHELRHGRNRGNDYNPYGE